MKRKITAIVALMAMILSLLPAGAWAEDAAPPDGAQTQTDATQPDADARANTGEGDGAIPASDVDAEADTPSDDAETVPDADAKDGALTVAGGALGTDYTYADGVLTILTGEKLTISGTTTSDHIVVTGGVTANITLENANIQFDDGDKSAGSGKGSELKAGTIAFALAGNSTVNLTLVGNNTLQSGVGCAALGVDVGSTVNIQGTGSLAVTGGFNGAGIGSGIWNNAGTINISGGTITAAGGNDAAAIGGGHANDNESQQYGGFEAISITGGTITANADGNAAAIGTGCWSKCDTGKITINNSVVEATTSGTHKQCAAIGRGISPEDDNYACAVTITNSIVTATNVADKGPSISSDANGNLAITDSLVQMSAGSESDGSLIVYGEVTLSENYTVTEGTTLVVKNGSALNTGNHTLTIDGNLSVIGKVEGTIENNGTLSINENGTVTTKGSLANKGTMAVAGTVTGDIANDGTIYQLTQGYINGTVTGNAVKTSSENVTYLNDVGEEVQTDQPPTLITPVTTALDEGWYVVYGNVTIDKRLVASGDVHLILADGATLTVNGGIQVQYDDNDEPPVTNSLTIYSQSTADKMGKLIVENVDDYNAGIGGDDYYSGGRITINGGNIDVTGGGKGAGIGGGDDGDAGTIVINGGIVTANAGLDAAAIGGGETGEGGSITINGGTVTATGNDDGAGKNDGAGIGSGENAAAGEITITGGTIVATGGEEYGAGIGGGENYAGGKITISGGHITATGGKYGAGIGGGQEGAGGEIIISGGTIIATGTYGAGIGGGVRGDDEAGGHGGTIHISGGTVTATSTDGGAAIGGGRYYDKDQGSEGGRSGHITIDGTAKVTVSTGESGAPLIGGGLNSDGSVAAESEWIDIGDTASVKDTAGKPVTITAPHHGSGNSAWKFDETYHWHPCAMEGCTDATHQPGKAKHDFTTLTNTDATTGARTYTCVCGKTETVNVKDISVSTAPTLTYRDGSTLDLSALKVSIRYDNDTTATLTYDDTALSYTIDGKAVTNGATLSKTAYNGKMLSVTCYGQTRDVGTLTVQTTGGGGAITPPTYPPTVTEPENGSVTTSPARPKQGETVTITPDPDAGYEVDKVTVTDKNGDSVTVTPKDDGTYTFTQPSGKVTITVTYRQAGEEPEPSDLPFTDVSEVAWYIDPVRFVYSEGLMTGTSATEFSPNLTTTRGMIVAILYRMEDEPDLSNENLGYPFADVDANAYYGDAVYWARLNGIVSGYSSDAFGPTDSITREQLAAILYNYAEYKGVDVSKRADLSAYTDSGSISGWATEAMQWANAEGIVNGMTATELAPKGNATRAQVAAMLQRYITNVIG